MHILVSANAAWNIWNFRRPLIEALLAEGHSVTVLSPRDESVTALQDLGCAFQHLDMDVKGINPLKDYALMRRFGGVFRKLQPDVILSFTIKNNIFGAFPAKAAGIPFVPNVTGLGTAFLSGALLKRIAVQLYRAAFRNLDVIFFQNPDDRDLFLAHRLATKDQAQLLPGSGIDLSRFTPKPLPSTDETVTFLMIARLLKDKGVVEFADAAREVKAAFPKAQFQLLGPLDAQNRTAVAAQTVQDWQNEGILTHLGATDDVRPFIAAADCVVLPSYREGAPRTLIEAAAMGRPLIATDVPGCRAVVDHNQTGFLCEVRNATSLAAACHNIIALSNPERSAMGQAGRAKIEKEYDQAIVVKSYLRALQGLNASDSMAAE